MLVVEMGAVNNRGEIAWTKVARAMGLSAETLRRWRTESSGYYQPDFAAMVDDVVPLVESGQVKRAFIDRAKPHAVVKITRELRTQGPKRPPESMRKALLIRYAAEVLHLELDESLKKDELLYEIDRAIAAQTTQELVVTKRETQRSMGDNTAGTLVAANYGPPEERWRQKTETDVKVPATLADIAAVVLAERAGEADDEPAGA